MASAKLQLHPKPLYLFRLMSGAVTIKGKEFKPFIDQVRIAEAVKEIAERMNRELKDEFPLFIVVLNGSFMFAADLLKEVTIPCEVSFVKIASYKGTVSTGKINELVGLAEDISGRNVVVVEDIVDSGLTMEMLMALLQEKKAANVRIATVLFKPGSFQKEFKIDYIGFEIPDLFVIGYGMDFNGEGRNLKEIFIIT
jgi:hypoxanthine phosphoribosyltransferase